MAALNSHVLGSRSGALREEVAWVNSSVVSFEGWHSISPGVHLDSNTTVIQRLHYLQYILFSRYLVVDRYLYCC